MCIKLAMTCPLAVEFRPYIENAPHLLFPPSKLPQVPSGRESLVRLRAIAPELEIPAFLRFIRESWNTLTPLTDELNALTHGPARFASYGRNLITDSAQMLIIYGIFPIESCRQMGKQARTYLFEDSRRRGQETYPCPAFG